MVIYKIVPPYAPFDYGSAVRVKVAPNPYEIDRGSIFGFHEIEGAKSAEEYAMPVGTVLALVESDSGAAFEIPICDLELI